MNFYTYVYRDPSRNNECIYVGKGKGRRAWTHLYRNDKHPLTHRLLKMKKSGVEPIIEFLCENVEEELALLCEEEAINLYGRRDLAKGPLLNLTDGGEGVSGVKPTPEAIAKRASSNCGKKRSPEVCAKISASKQEISAETCAKISASKRGISPSLEIRTAISLRRLGKKHTPETIAKMSDARRKWHAALKHSNNLTNTTKEA